MIWSDLTSSSYVWRKQNTDIRIVTHGVEKELEESGKLIVLKAEKGWRKKTAEEERNQTMEK